MSEAPITAIAVYCSDGRIAGPVDDFLRGDLDLPRCDRIALPGGPAMLAGHSEAHLPAGGVLAEFEFLLAAHGVERVLLIAHEGCAFYRARLGLDEELVGGAQAEDLADAAARIERTTGIRAVTAYVARPRGDGFAFEETPVGLSP